MTAVPVALRGRRTLSPVQRALYASQQRHPRAPMQNMAHLVHLDGPIDPARLGDAFAAVVAASDVLRTTFVAGAGGETELRLSDEPATTDVVDVARAEAAAWAQQRAAEALPLGRRAYDSVVLAHEDGTVSWYLALHHCVTDAASSGLVFARTSDAYEGEPVELDSYYEWAERAGEHPGHAPAQRHWDARSAAPRIGALYERGVASTPSSTRIPLPDDVLDGLAELVDGPFRSFSADLAWATALLTGTAVYLHRITGSDRFALGLPVHNRSRPDARDLIGPLVEVYPVDVVIEPGDTFTELQRRIGRSLNHTLRFALPGTAPNSADVEAVVNVLPGGHPTSFASVPATLRWIHAGAIDAGHLLRVQLSRFGPPQLALDVNHAAAAPPRHRRAARHFETVLRTMVADPDSPVTGFPILGEEERRVVEAWGEGPRQPPVRPAVELLADALTGAEHVALVDGERSWTGRELWRRVTDVATELRAAGVGPGGRVAVEIERSADAVIAILAVLVAGGSYVPIDPAQPAARRARLVERAGCVVTLSELPPERRLDQDVGAPSAPDPIDLDGEAYLLFTSGSTGEPKGVPISHRGLAGYLAFASASYLEPGARPVVPLFSELTFDLTVTSLFLALISGGRTIVVRGDGPTAVRRLAALPEVTWCKATPSHLELLVRLLPGGQGPATLVVGGEAFGTALAERLRRAIPGVRIFNEYGPTEAVVGCMIHEWEPDVFPGCPDVPIGVPAPGVGLRVADADGTLVPPGVVGELWIAGPGLTAGYLDGDDRAFVERDGRRWYRSGDLVRMLDDQTLVYLRRADEQLKVGGIRLDPSEIEAALETHPSVRRVAVRSWSAPHQAPTQHCVRCGLADNVPAVTFDEHGVCDRCHAYDRVRDRAGQWFRDPTDLVALRDRARAERSGAHDCVALLSGGKDSTYALFQLVQLGFDVYALTLDNGFISDDAKDNVRRSVAALGIDHEFATADEMAAIFRDSLERHSNVCHGCFKTIYTFGTNRAVELGAPLVVTGLSRGQLFETRLIPAQFADDRFDPDAIDAAVVAARRAYHRVDDAVRRLLPTDVFDEADLFERVTYVDFYRYVDVELGEMLRFLDEEAPWVRPGDTGRSTNCRINAAGIQTHLLEQGYHNYAEPYAWDVRLGHKRRDEALAELDDRDDADEVAAMLAEVGYVPHRREVLTAWIEVAADRAVPSPAQLRAHLQGLLPAAAVPAAFVVVDELPMTANGKLDTGALPAPQRMHRSSPTLVVAPTSPLERTIAELWERRLGLETISVDDDFFALGGDSLAALEMTVALGAELGVEIPDAVAFAHATPRTLAAALAELLPEGEPPADSPPVRRGPEAGAGGTPPALSTGERAMLFEHRQRPDDPRYNQGRCYRVDGPVDPARLHDALRSVVDRHQPLHWTFGTPRRRLAAAAAVDFRHAEVATWSDARALARDLHRRPFDLDGGPLLRGALISVGDGSSAIVLATHHVSTDASSFERLWVELEAAYHGERREPPAVAYADHTTWQASMPADGDAAFWRDAIGEVPRMALHRPAPPEPDGLRTRTAAVRTDELRAATGTPPFATVLAALGVVLGRYCDADHATVGALVSTRDHPCAEDLIGYYLNTLPLTIDTAPDLPLGALRAQCGEQLADALGHRTFPFAEMVADRRRHDLPDPTPQVLVALQDLDDVEFGRGTAPQEILFTGSAVADATFFVQLRHGSVELAVEHRGAEISAATADQLLADLDRALAAVVRRSGDAVGSVELTARSVLAGPPAGEAVPVVASIERHMERLGDRPAVRCGAAELSWSELDRRSADVADRMIASGVEPGDRVLVAVPRSVELVAAIVGVLRAGAAYVPLDPTYPLARNRAIASSARARAIVGERTAAFGLDLLELDPTGSSASPDHGRRPPPSLDRPAYVIFTSGSTGEPRGVEIGHRQLALSTAARSGFYPSDPGAFLVVSSMAFDSSVAGLFWALTSGGTVVLPTDGEVHDVDALHDLLASGAVDHTLLVPALYRAVLSRSTAGGPWPAQVIVAGEACGVDVVDRHHVLHRGSRLTNEYGPTEATVWVTAAHLDAPCHAVPIGSPIAGVWTAVVDRHGAPCPPGVVGGLLVGGATVATGYDGVESDRFLASSELGPGRAFRTGDRAAAVAGELHFHGRDDEQLNVGGMRVEPAEIEAVLTSVPGVEQAVVVARDVRPIDRRIAAVPAERLAAAMRLAATSDDPRTALERALADRGAATLVAHLEGAAIDLAEVRRHVVASLPAATRPAVLQVAAALPRMPNGKVDRAAVAGLPVEHHARPADFGPVGLDGLVADFRDVLGHDHVGPDDDFFEAGGDSLLALELLLRVEQRSGVRLRVSVLLESSTPRQLAAALDLGALMPAAAGDDAIVLRPGAAGGPPLWLWPGADGALLVFQQLAARFDADLRVLGVEFPGTRGERPPMASVEELGAHCHAVLRAAQPVGPYRMLGYSLGGLVAVDVARRLLADGHRVDYVGAIESGLAGVTDPRGRAAKFAEAWREQGPLTAVGRVATSLRLQASEARDSVREVVEGRAIDRFGMRPSDRLLFLRMERTLRAAGLRYEPPSIDVEVDVYLGDDVSTRWWEAMEREWAAVAGRGVRVQRVAGSHVDNSMLLAPHVDSLAGAVARDLDRRPGG